MKRLVAAAIILILTSIGLVGVVLFWRPADIQDRGATFAMVETVQRRILPGPFISKCEAGQVVGSCIETADCASPFVSTPGRCPRDPASVRCCTPPHPSICEQAFPSAGKGHTKKGAACLCSQGRCDRLISDKEARSRGLLVLDLSDDWAPPILSARDPGGKQPTYRQTYVGLANDRIN